jgi:hypothetical protein
MRVTNGLSLGSSLLLPVHTVICVQTLKAQFDAVELTGVPYTESRHEPLLPDIEAVKSTAAAVKELYNKLSIDILGDDADFGVGELVNQRSRRARRHGALPSLAANPP